MSSPERKVRAHAIRYTVPPRDVPKTKIARLLYLTVAEFEAALPELTRRGFPRPDTTTGHYDLAVVNEWMDRRHDKANAQESEQSFDDQLDDLVRHRRRGSL